MEWGIPTALGGLLAVWVGVGLATGRFGVENAKYTVVRRWGSLELRNYPAHVEATIPLREADVQHASGRGFQPLAKYIFGSNAQQQSIAMTTPVIITKPPSANAPHRVSFVLPSKHALPALPQPNDSRVELVQHEAHLHAVRRLSAFTLAPRFEAARLERELAALEEEAAAAGLTWDPSTVQRSVRAYDPPWCPFFISRTEVSLHPVQER